MEYAMKSFSIYLSSQLEITLFHAVSQIISFYSYISKNAQNTPSEI